MSGFVIYSGDIYLIILVVTLENIICTVNLIMFKCNPIFLLNNKNDFKKKSLVQIASPPITGIFHLLSVLSIFEPSTHYYWFRFVCSMPLSWWLCDWVMPTMPCPQQLCSAPVHLCLWLLLWHQPISCVVFNFSCCLLLLSFPKNLVISWCSQSSTASIL